MAITIFGGVKIKLAKLVEKTKHASAFVYYLHPTRSRREKREAVVKMKAIATENRKTKEKAIRKDSQNPKPRREPNHFHFHFNNCTCLRCQGVSVQ